MLSVSVIGGYLGAGKTTLVNHLLRHAGGARLAILVNEFGALPIDEDLIEAQDDTLISIAGGCICCSFGNDLIQAMLDLAALSPPPDHVLIESSGVALPGAIAASVSILDGFQLDGIIVVVDAETIQDQAQDPYIGDTITRQLADANSVVVNKIDLVGADHLTTLTAWLAKVAPNATLIHATKGAVPKDALLQNLSPDVASLPQSIDHTAASFGRAAFPMPGQYIAAHIAAVLVDPAWKLVRAKGFVDTVDGVQTVQVVGRRSNVSPAPKAAKPGLVVISQSATLDILALQNALDACRSD